MKKIIKYLSSILLIVVLLIFLLGAFHKEKSAITLKVDKIDLNGVNNLMVVAHPDDESLWGGEHIISDYYLVVCVTCVDKNRIEEFKSVMEMTDNRYLILGYPDKTNGEKDDWSTSYDNIKSDLTDIINYKSWKTIVTHNPDGEYGHIHHKMLSKIVTSISPKNRLFYFNKYFSEEEQQTLKMDKISRLNLNKKEEILTKYESQEAIINNHRSNIIYEKFIPYSEWNY